MRTDGSMEFMNFRAQFFDLLGLSNERVSEFATARSASEFKFGFNASSLIEKGRGFMCRRSVFNRGTEVTGGDFRC